MTRVSLAHYYEAHDRVVTERERDRAERSVRLTAMQRAMGTKRIKQHDGYTRMAKCRAALNALDRRGWERSFHQRLFHDHFIRACARIFFKTEPAGTFAKEHQRILQLNSWDNLSQEILVSTPRRSVTPAQRV